MPSDKRIESNDAVAVQNKSGTKVIGRTSDLGLGGCYVDTLSPFPVGTEAKIKILRDNESFDAQAKVVYSLMGMGMGLAFVSALPKQVRVFQRWLQEISGQPPLAEETHPPSASDASPAQQTDHDAHAEESPDGRGRQGLAAEAF
jgi:PilZ domain